MGDGSSGVQWRCYSTAPVFKENGWEQSYRRLDDKNKQVGVGRRGEASIIHVAEGPRHFYVFPMNWYGPRELLDGVINAPGDLPEAILKTLREAQGRIQSGELPEDVARSRAIRP